MQDNPAQGFGAVMGLFSVLILPFALVRWVLRLWREAEKSGRWDDTLTASWATAISSWFLALPLAYRYRLDRAFGISPAWSLTLPLGVTLFGLLVLSSLLRIITGRGVTWKGRTYATKL